MDNFELNKAIAELVYPDHTWELSGSDSLYCYSRAIEGGFGFAFSVFETWDDLMPLVVEHGISLGYLSISKRWDGYVMHPDNFATNENPQRALAECLLLVLKDNNNE